jgi:hypothetical protein
VAAQFYAARFSKATREKFCAARPAPNFFNAMVAFCAGVFIVRSFEALNEQPD